MAALGGNTRAVAGSVTDAGDLDRLYDTVKQEHGKLDILFANAGTGALAPLSEITPDHVDATFDVNVKGTIFTVQKGLKLMEAGGSASPAVWELATKGHRYGCCQGPAVPSTSRATQRPGWKAGDTWL